MAPVNLKNKVRNKSLFWYYKYNGKLPSITGNKDKTRADLEANRLLLELPILTAFRLLKHVTHSKAQLMQDLFVLAETKLKKNGFFVEFGATNGVDLSNTYLLEKEFGWSGILAEPAKRWHADLWNNRNCEIETNCVWQVSNATLTFNEANIAKFSTINSYSAVDLHREARKDGKAYDVKTISLFDLLQKHNAPEKIDYLSIDTEGSELDILSAFNFDRYQISVITCEHNYTAARDKIFSLLTRNGYVRKFQNLSEFDDWYVRPPS